MTTEEKVHQLLLSVFRDKELVENWLNSPNYLLGRVPNNMLLNDESDELLYWLEDTISELRSRI
jgi:hypothetical protein